MRQFIFSSLLGLIVLAGCTAESGTEASDTDLASTQEPTPGPDAANGTQSGGAVSGESEQSTDSYGADFKLTEAIEVKELLANPESFMGGPHLVEGTVVDLCSKMGCWMVMSDGETEIRVTMKEHDSGISDPEQRKGVVGGRATIEGTVVQAESDPDRTAHLESESARPDLMPEKQGMKYEFVATSLKVTRIAEGG